MKTGTKVPTELFPINHFEPLFRKFTTIDYPWPMTFSLAILRELKILNSNDELIHPYENLQLELRTDYYFDYKRQWITVYETQSLFVSLQTALIIARVLGMRMLLVQKFTTKQFTVHSRVIRYRVDKQLGLRLDYDSNKYIPVNFEVNE